MDSALRVWTTSTTYEADALSTKSTFSPQPNQPTKHRKQSDEEPWRTKEPPYPKAIEEQTN
jgi:hypothetical protein